MNITKSIFNGIGNGFFEIAKSHCGESKDNKEKKGYRISRIFLRGGVMEGQEF